MLKIWAKIIKNNKIINDIVVESNVEGSYQQNLKVCMEKLCNKLDISRPYWLQSNLDEYNRRSKTSFNENNFIEENDFDKLIIEELDLT